MVNNAENTADESPKQDLRAKKLEILLSSGDVDSFWDVYVVKAGDGYLYALTWEAGITRQQLCDIAENLVGGIFAQDGVSCYAPGMWMRFEVSSDDSE